MTTSHSRPTTTVISARRSESNNNNSSLNNLRSLSSSPVKMRRDRRRAAQFWSARKRNNQSSNNNNNNNHNTSHDQDTSFQSCNSGNPIISIIQDPPPPAASTQKTQQSNHLPSSLNVSHPSYFHQSKDESQEEEVNTSASTSFHSAATTSAIDPLVYKHMELLAVVPLQNNEQDKKKKSKPHNKMRQRFSSSSNNNNHSHNLRNRLLSRHRILLDNHSNLNNNNTGDPGPIDETKQDDREEPPSLAKKNIALQQQKQDESIQLFSPPRLPKQCSVDDNVLLDHNYLQSLEKRVQKERLMQLQVDCSHDQKEQENDNEKETSDLFPLELFNPSDDQDKENNEFLATAAPPRLCKQPRQQPPSGSPFLGRGPEQDEEQDLISEILEPKLPPSPLLDKKNKTKSILKQVRFAPPDSLEHIEWLEQTAAQERLLALQQVADKNKKKQRQQWDYYDNNGDTFRNFWKDLQRGPKSQCGTLLLQRQCHPRDFGLEEGRHDDEYDYEDETTDHSRSTDSRRPSTLWGALADEFTALVDTLVREYEHTNNDDKEKDLLNTSWDATTITTEASSVSSCSSSSKPPQLAVANELLEE